MTRWHAAAALFWASCASAAHFSDVAGKFDCPDIGNSFACAASIESSLRVPFLHRTSKERLDVDLMDGRVHSFIDVDADDGTAMHYNALEAGTADRYVVIHRQFYEGSGYGLLDRRSGAFTGFDGYPVFSPDGRWLAVVDGGEDDEGVVQIFAVTNGTFHLVFNASPGKWWPEQVHWQSSSQLVFERATLAASASVEVKTVLSKVQFNGSQWR